MTVTLALFGAFRDLHSAPTLTLEVDGDSIADLRAQLCAHLEATGKADKRGLVGVSAFASDTALLRDHDRIPADGQLAILPPVSGG
ncbi:MoaD/ThiS family protein [Pseudomarimonas arenosa]|uniref:MoaD/ThiS family protein n=1 Tax=Pseudomarimonas arenosa TaxID=2774145 RepID=A0AAW3ZPN0_9GAMM|nr:MoaD/ThiS family protein [Pseudomarimonas arenosa]MBD8527449.1 MoaD/ThiS family protein [Pseudomarimonas arenosa]